MKILAITGAFLPEIGGMQFSTQQTLLALAQQGVEVELLCPTHVASETVDNLMPFEVIRATKGTYLAAIKRTLIIRKLWKDGGYDQLLLMGHYEEVAYGLLSSFYPVRPIILAAGTRLPFDGGFIKKWIRNSLLCRAYKKSKKIIAISSATENYINEYCDCINTKFIQIPRPIDGNIWKRLRNKKNKDFILVTFGRLEKAKNIQEVIDVVDSLKSKIPNIKYWIVGDGEYELQLKNKVKKLGLHNNVSFYQSMSQEKVVDLIQDVDVNILLSRHYAGESFGRVYVEGAAVGLPAIGYSSEGVKVAINHQHSGYLCDVGNLICVENAIYELYADKNLYRQMKSNALSHYEQNFTLEKVGQKIKKVLYD